MLARTSVVLAVAVIGAGLVPSQAGLAITSPPVVRDDAACQTTKPTLEGTPGSDVLVGTPGKDVILGLQGDDIIRGLQGNDLLCGGPGADVIYGQAGDDRLFGQSDRIRMWGDSDHTHWGDRLVGGVGSDVLNIGRAVEPEYKQPEIFDFSDLPAGVVVDLTAGTAVSGADTDELAGYDGVLHDRRVLGTDSSDRLFGTRDDDELWGRGGDDLILAGVGGDRLRGGSGDDRLFGQRDHDGSRDPYEPGSGGDEIYPGAGEDLVVPGADGSQAFYGDTLRFDGSTRGVRVDLGAGTATGQGRDTLRIEEPVSLFGSAHDDVLKGGRFAEILVGLNGDDRVSGRRGNDELYGDGEYFNQARGRGRDRLFGGEGRDFLDGGPLADRLNGGPDRDSEYDTTNNNTCTSVEREQRAGC